MSHETIQILLIRNESEETRPATGDEILRAARDVMSRRVRRGTSMSSPQVVRDFLSIKLGMLEHETFCVMFLDSRHKLIEFVELFRGTVDGASVYPREVVKLALAKNAAAVVCAHPHPLCCVWCVTPGSQRRWSRRKSQSVDQEREGSCPVFREIITPVAAVKALRCSRASRVPLLAEWPGGQPLTAALRRDGNPRGQSAHKRN